MDVEVLSDGAATLATGEFGARFGELMLGELRLPAELDAFATSDLPAFLSTPNDALAFILGQGGQKGEEALTYLGGEVEVRLVENPDRGSVCMNALHDGDTVKHGSRCPIPLGKHQHVALAEGADGALQLRPALHVLARGLLGKDGFTRSSCQRPELVVEVLVSLAVQN